VISHLKTEEPYFSNDGQGRLLGCGGSSHSALMAWTWGVQGRAITSSSGAVHNDWVVAPSLVVGASYHAAFTIADGGQKHYLNGALVASFASPGVEGYPGDTNPYPFEISCPDGEFLTIQEPVVWVGYKLTPESDRNGVTSNLAALNTNSTLTTPSLNGGAPLALTNGIWSVTQPAYSPFIYYPLPGPAAAGDTPRLTAPEQWAFAAAGEVEPLSYFPVDNLGTGRSGRQPFRPDQALSPNDWGSGTDRTRRCSGPTSEPPTRPYRHGLRRSRSDRPYPPASGLAPCSVPVLCGVISVFLSSHHIIIGHSELCR
jgi:hypothetical protein